MSIEAIKLALRSLDIIRASCSAGRMVHADNEAAIAEHILRQALETEQDPVAWLDAEMSKAYTVDELADSSGTGFLPLYTAPPKREWVGLTADEIWKCNKAKSGSAVEFHICYAHQNVLDFAESIEAKLKEKNT